ncbi:MAG: anti-sigma factor family protein [Candidatus Korobacteraceae bacterium]
MADQIQPGMQCVEVEALLADAIDGTLHGATLAMFEAHRDSCPACRTMVEEASRGLHWLKGLDEVEPPRHLVHNILAQTIGQVPEPRPVLAPKGESWLERLKGKLSPMFAPVVTPRFAMSFGMAFFSITMLLSIAGFHVADLRHVDLSAKGITKAYYSTETRVVRYYENIRLVYEIETRVRDLRRGATPQQQDDPAPQNNQPKGDDQQDKDRRNQNYNREMGQPALASSPSSSNQVKDKVISQARLNRSNG